MSEAELVVQEALQAHADQQHCEEDEHRHQPREIQHQQQDEQQITIEVEGLMMEQTPDSTVVEIPVQEPSGNVDIPTATTPAVVSSLRCTCFLNFDFFQVQ